MRLAGNSLTGRKSGRIRMIFSSYLLPGRQQPFRSPRQVASMAAAQAIHQKFVERIQGLRDDFDVG